MGTYSLVQEKCPPSLQFEFAIFKIATWQNDQPMHSQSAEAQNVKAEFIQLSSRLYAQPCSMDGHGRGGDKEREESPHFPHTEKGEGAAAGVTH